MSKQYNTDDNDYIFECSATESCVTLNKHYINEDIHLVQTLKKKLKDELISGTNEDLYETILRKFDLK